MRVKTITITLEAYEALKRLKKPGESFSDVILRLVKKHKSLLDLAGSWSDLDNESIEGILREFKNAWSR